jgi:hypothetical protein
MKVSKILLASAMLGSMMLASCGGPEAGESTADASASTSKAASSKKSSTSKFSAIWSRDASQHVDANCEHEGKDVDVCINSSMSNKETVIAKTPHTWGTRSEKHTEEGKTGYWTNECSVCHTKAIILDALEYTKKDGENKDKTGATLKLDKPNGSYVEYEFTMPEAATSADIAVYGWVDYWYDNRNNNQERGFFNGSDPNVGVNINGKDLTITNKKTYEQMGMKAGENGNGSFTLCEMGAFGAIAAGPTKLTYTRLGSYNLNITEIWIIYK